jgi:cysteine desulfurase
MMKNPVKIPIYLDYMATTPVDTRVKQRMMGYLDKDGIFGNTASRSHSYGWLAEEAVEQARQQVAALVNADASSIIWTSGATESDNLAIKGAARFYQRKGKHIVTCKTEHKAVLDTCAALQKEGFEVTYLTPEANGLLDLNKLEQALRSDTVLISIMHANNEIGVIQDLAAIGELARAKGILFHTDAAQSAGKIPIDLSNLPVDLMSFSGHKVYGPKGIGALYVRQKPRVRLEPLIHGGGHEQGLRSGTLPTHQIVGMGEAFKIAKAEMEAESQRVLKLRQRLWAGISQLSGVAVNGDMEQRIPGNLNVSFQGVDGESLLVGLKDLALSSGSACTSASIEPSYVLRALGLSDALAHSSLRISFGRFTTEAEIDYAIEHIQAVVRKLRDMAP